MGDEKKTIEEINTIENGEKEEYKNAEEFGEPLKS